MIKVLKLPCYSILVSPFWTIENSTCIPDVGHETDGKRTRNYWSN